MSGNAPVGDWFYYGIGIILLILGIIFVLIPIVSRNVDFSNFRIPWIILYVYKSGGFYFATSPLLLIISAVGLILFFIRR